MKKGFRRALSLGALLLAVAVALVGCGGSKETTSSGSKKPTKPKPSVPSYDISKRVPTDEGEDAFTVNQADYPMYHNYIEVPLNGKVYSVGDPFIMRHGNRYYLYVSTPAAQYEPTRRKIGVWRSDNLVDWEQLPWAYDPDTDPDGGVHSDVNNPNETATEGAFAPEVIYYKGWFYMCESQSGHGHYFLRSKTPEGPFRVISRNMGLGIDGTFALMDDGQLYFVSANNVSNYINAVPIDFVDGPSGDVKDCQVVIDEEKLVNLEVARLGGWTEGPGFFARNGYRYMTFTGNHVDSASYRVAYAYTKGLDPTKDLVAPWNNVLLATSGMRNEAPDPYNSLLGKSELTTFRGSGHSSNAVGPNIDSVFTAFHVANRTDHLNNKHDAIRKLGVTQYFTNGSYVLTNGMGNYDRPKPDMPDYVGDVGALQALGGMRVSPVASGAVYTAEFSFVLSGGRAEVRFGVTDANNYVSAAVNGGKLTLTRVQGGGATQLGEANVFVSKNAESEHIIKIVNGANKAVLYYDNMAVIEVNSALPGGKIGFASGTARTLAFSNDAFGTSDFEAVKDLRGGSWAAFSYLKGENRGYSLSKGAVRADGVRQGEKETTKSVTSPEGTATVLSKGDWVKYLVNAPQAGYYSLNLTLGKGSKGAIYEVIIDNQSIFLMNTPTKDDFGEGEYANLRGGVFEIKEPGVHTLKVRVFYGTLDVMNMSAEYDATAPEEFNDLLNDRNTTVFQNELGSPSVSQQGLVTSAADPRTLALGGHKGNANYEFTVNVRLLGNGTSGILFRMNNYSYTYTDTVKLGTFYSGYFLSFQRSSIKLEKKLYDKSETLGVAKLTNGQFFNTQFITMTVRAVNGRIIISAGDEELLNVLDEDAFLTGYIGLYSEDKSSIIFSDFKYKDIGQ